MTAIKEAKRRIEESQNAPKQTADEAYEHSLNAISVLEKAQEFLPHD